ncbi:MAG: hypothetical protein ACR2P7_04750 [bacterium]
MPNTENNVVNAPKPILNCRVRFKFKCPQDWNALTPTAEARIRHCGVCERQVHWCASEAEMTTRARRGECVAGAFVADGESEVHISLGEIAPTYGWARERDRET